MDFMRMNCKGSGGGRYYGNGKFLLRVFITVYYGLLRILRSFITDVTGLSLRILLTLNQDTKKSLETLTFEKNLEKSSQFITDITEYYGYYGNRYYGILRNITDRNISPALKGCGIGLEQEAAKQLPKSTATPQGIVQVSGARGGPQTRVLNQEDHPEGRMTCKGLG